MKPIDLAGVKVKPRKTHYLVELFKVTADSDLGEEHTRYPIYRQETWATSPKQAENNVRHNSEWPFHGRVEVEGTRWFSFIDARVSEIA